MRKILWLLPPLLGVAFYAAGSMAGSREVSSARGADRVGDRAGMLGDRIVPVGASRWEMEKVVLDEAAAENARIGSCNAEELKAMMLQIMGRLKGLGDDSLAKQNDLWVFLSNAATCLGKLERGAALPWLLEHAPGERQSFMDGWAEVDPAGAFEAVVRSDVMRPCFDDTLQKLLQGFARQGPESLAAACRRAPWALISSPYVQADPDGDVRVWIESGILPELQRRGVRCGSILSEWAEQYPREVLARWRAGDELLAANREILTGMLRPLPTVSPEREKATAAALSELPEEDRGRLLRLMGLSPGDPEYALGMSRDFDPDRARKFFSEDDP